MTFYPQRNVRQSHESLSGQAGTDGIGLPEFFHGGGAQNWGFPVSICILLSRFYPQDIMERTGSYIQSCTCAILVANGKTPGFAPGKSSLHHCFSHEGAVPECLAA